jgi:hypothetical protein
MFQASVNGTNWNSPCELAAVVYGVSLDDFGTWNPGKIIDVSLYIVSNNEQPLVIQASQTAHSQLGCDIAGSYSLATSHQLQNLLAQTFQSEYAPSAP